MRLTEEELEGLWDDPDGVVGDVVGRFRVIEYTNGYSSRWHQTRMLVLKEATAGSDTLYGATRTFGLTEYQEDEPPNPALVRLRAVPTTAYVVVR